jgi:dienelactone hydrolase
MKVKLCLVSAGVPLLAAFFMRTAITQPAPETTGPYKVVMEMDSSLAEHVVCRPADLAVVKGKLPVVAFGNGACANAGNAFEFYLREVASHGFLVVANGPIDPAPLPAGRPPKPPEKADYTKQPSVPAKSTTIGQLYETMDWAKAQNADKASRYYGKLDAANIGVMGQSCGGQQALTAAGDPRVKTAIVMNSGTIRPTSVIPIPAGRGIAPTPQAGPEAIGKLHAPLIYIIGGPSDHAYERAETDFHEIQSVPVFKANMDTGHNGTLWQPHGGKFAEIATQWLLWQLKQDKKAAGMFEGTNCGYCRDAELKVEHKNLK